MNKTEALVVTTGIVSVLVNNEVSLKDLGLTDSDLLTILSRIAKIVENYREIEKEVSDQEFKKCVVDMLNKGLDILEGNEV